MPYILAPVGNGAEFLKQIELNDTSSRLTLGRNEVTGLDDYVDKAKFANHVSRSHVEIALVNGAVSDNTEGLPIRYIIYIYW